MQAKKLSPFRGWGWLIEGLAFVGSLPAALISASSVLVLCILGLLLIQGLGPILLFLLMPVFEIGMFLICRELSEGQRVKMGVLFEGFRMKLRPLFALGGIRLLGHFVVLILAMSLTGVDVARLEQLAADKASATGLPPSDQLRMIGVFVLLRLPIEMAAWFAAPFISLRGQPLKKALFFSLVACWRNFGAWLVFQIGFWVLSSFLLGIVLSVGNISGLLVMPLLALWALISVAVFYASFYRCACDVFGEWPHPLTHEL